MKKGDVAEAIIGQAGLIFGRNWNGETIRSTEKRNIKEYSIMEW